MAHPPPSPESRTELLESLLARALELQEAGETRAMQDLLREHPTEAPTIMEALADLARADLLTNSDPDGKKAPGMPRTFDDFEVIDELGSGGMGVVYRARQHSLEREVALKVIRPELLLFEGARERFRREIDAVARLDHPAIVPVYATGNVNGVPYYVMPCLRGASAQDAIVAMHDRQHLTGAELRAALGRSHDESETGGDDTFEGPYWQAVVRLIRKAALGIQHAHVRGVLHRDLKPSNIYFTPSGQAVVLDFGLARAGGDPQLTRTGSAAGSPAYMSPEQVRGEPADERTDVYGLAATLHSLLARQPPFASDTEEALRSRILAGDREDLGNTAEIPAELEIVIASAMDLEREHRYASCEQFADDLQRVLDGRPITARPLPIRVRARRFVQRNRAISAATGVAAAFLILLPLLLYWQQLAASTTLQEQVRETNSANTKLEQTNQQLARTNGDLQTANKLLSEVNQALKTQIERSDKSVNVSLVAVQRLLASTATRKLGRRNAPQEVVAGLLRNAYDLFGELEFDDKFDDKVLEMRLHALEGLSSVYQSMGNLKGAEAVADKIRDMLGDGELPRSKQTFRAGALRTKAAIKLDRREHEGVPELLEQAREIYERFLGDEKFGKAAVAEIGYLDSMIAGLAMRAGKTDEAEAALRRAVATTLTIADDERAASSHGINRVNLARFLKSNRRYDEALAEVDVQLKELEELPADPDEISWPIPRYVRAMGQCERARLLQLMKRIEPAIAASRVAIESLDQLVRDFPDVPELQRLRGTVYGNLAIVHGNRKEWDTAIPLARNAVADEREALRMMPDDLQAQRFELSHHRYLCFALRQAGRWRELTPEVMRLGGNKIPGLWREGLARDLMRILENEPTAKTDELREQAITWLQQAQKDGRKIRKDNSLYDPIRDDPRFVELR